MKEERIKEIKDFVKSKLEKSCGTCGYYDEVSSKCTGCGMEYKNWIETPQIKYLIELLEEIGVW